MSPDRSKAALPSVKEPLPSAGGRARVRPLGTGVDRAAPSRVEAIARRRVRGFAPLLAAVLSTDDARAVHDLRVITRRLQQCCDAIAGRPRPPEARRVVKALRRLRRGLGEWRNYDVALALVARRIRRTRSPVKRRAWRRIAELLEHGRRAEIDRSRRRLVRQGIAGLVSRAQRVLTVLPAGADPDASLRAAAARALEAWSAALAAAQQARDAGALHRLRIAGKRLRYSIELAADLGETTVAPVVRWLKDVQDELGGWNDRQTLYRLAAAAFAQPEVLLGDLEAARVVLGEIARERDSDAAAVDRILDLAERRGPRAALERWIGVDEAEAPAKR